MTAFDCIHEHPHPARLLATLEASLASRPFLAGNALSAADCTALPFLQHLVHAAGKEAARPLGLDFMPLAGRYPALAAWLTRMEALPGYERTYPPHWR